MSFKPKTGDVLLLEKKGPAGRVIGWWQRVTGVESKGDNLTHCCTFTKKTHVFNALPLGLKEHVLPKKYTKHRHVLFRKKNTVPNRYQISKFIKRHDGRWYSHFLIIGFGLMEWFKLDKNPFSIGNICTKECYMWMMDVLSDNVLPTKYDRNSMKVEDLYEYLINSNEYELIYDSQK